MADRWFVMQVQAQLMETAEYHMRRQGFIPFFPRLLIRKTRKITTTELMFKGYGFVNFDVDRDPWGSINGTRGVVGLLPRHLLRPTPMPEGFVEGLLANDPTPEDGFLDVLEDFFPGITEVEVTENHKLLAGRRGLVVGVRSNLLQISFTWANSNQSPVAPWIDKDMVVPLNPTKVKK